eukprot:g2286.t1
MWHGLPTKDTELQQKLITAKNKSYVCITIPKGNLQTVSEQCDEMQTLAFQAVPDTKYLKKIIQNTKEAGCRYGVTTRYKFTHIMPPLQWPHLK